MASVWSLDSNQQEKLVHKVQRRLQKAPTSQAVMGIVLDANLFDVLDPMSTTLREMLMRKATLLAREAVLQVGARKQNKKRRSSASTVDLITDDDDESSISIASESEASDDSVGTADLGLGDDSEASASDDESVINTNEEDKQFAAQKQSRRIPWNEIDMNADERYMTFAQRVDNRRMVNYRKACEMVKHWLESVDTLELPANPLDRLLNELGGPDQVAEVRTVSAL